MARRMEDRTSRMACVGACVQKMAIRRLCVTVSPASRAGLYTGKIREENERYLASIAHRHTDEY
jgi:hypothetical protein